MIFLIMEIIVDALNVLVLLGVFFIMLAYLPVALDK